MAHLTTVARNYGISVGLPFSVGGWGVFVPGYLQGDPKRFHTLPCWGIVIGAAVMGSTPMPFVQIVCIYEATRAVVFKGVAGSDGVYTIPHLYLGSADDTYTIIAYQSGENARIFSGIRPADPYL